MNNSNYITASQNYAKNAQDAYEQSLSYLLTGLDEAKVADQNAANIRYQNLITQIRQQLPNIQQQFERNAKAAYINKQQSLQQIDADLNRLGVNTQGFGVTQRLLNENAYGQAYGDVLLQYNNNLRDVANQEVNALGDLNAELADLDAAYAKDKLDTQKYIDEQGRNIYNTEYKNYYNDLQYQDQLKQQQWENSQAEKKYQDQLKQQAWENQFKEKQYQDQLKQQQWERQLAEKEYQLKVKQVNASIAASRRVSSSYKTVNTKTNNSNNSNNSNNNYKNKDRVVNTNYCLWLNSKSKKAQTEYDALVTKIANDGGIKASILNKYLSQGQKNGIFTSSDVSKIKKQFGI